MSLGLAIECRSTRNLTCKSNRTIGMSKPKKPRTYKTPTQQDLAKQDYLGRPDWRNLNLRGIDLSGQNMSYSWLSYVDLTGANLRSVDFSNASLEGAILTGADLTNACFVETNLKGANLEGAKLVLANFLRANLDGAIMPEGYELDDWWNKK